jgi:ectoine hydroxylase-related dioxygenase (phytanoyl-CoA dioxygenase family)
MDIGHYGVTERRRAKDEFDVHVQELEYLGYTVVESGLSVAELDSLRTGLDQLLGTYTEEWGGSAFLEDIGESDQIRAPLAFDEQFLSVATNCRILEIARRMLGGYFLLTQQNGIVNRPSVKAHHQSAFHRDLPYQHFVSSRAIALNALLCIDAFDAEAGSTTILPASHKEEDFPSEEYIRQNMRAMVAPAGSFIVMNSMLYHRAGHNRSNRLRRAINNVYALPFVKQQIVLPCLLNGKWSDDPGLARLLGYHSDPPRSIAEFIAGRVARARQKSGA